MAKNSFFSFLKSEFSSNYQQPLYTDEESSNFIRSDRNINMQSNAIRVNIPYNPKLYPADIKQCEEHAKARRVSFPNHLFDRMLGKSKNEGPIDVCDCCGYPVANKLIPLTGSCHDLLFLGSGYPLFFIFIKYGISLLFMILLISGLYNVITNVEGYDCDNNLEILGKKCEPDSFTQTSLLNKAHHSEYLKSQEVLNLLSVLFTMVFLHVLRYRQRKLAFECDLQTVTASDYTIQVENLPEKFDEEKLKHFLEHLPLKRKEEIKVFKIIPSYYINELMEWINQQTEISNNLLFLQSIKEHLQNNIKTNDNLYSRKKAENNLKDLIQIEEKDTRILKKLEENIEIQRENFKNVSIFTGIAYVTFQTPYQAQLVKAFFKLSFMERMKRSYHKQFKKESKFLFEGHSIRITRAPEPNEILWENLGVSDIFRLKQRVLNFILTFIILLLSFVIILAIYYLQSYISDNDFSSFTQYTVSYAGCLSIVIINNVLVLIVTFLAKREKHQNYTDYDISLTQKKTAALFLNSACIYILVAISTNRFFGSNGLIYNIFSVFLSNLVIQPLLYLLAPRYLYKIYKQRKLRKDPKAYQITQQQANMVFEGDAFEITVCYSSVLNVMLFSAFYAPLLPLSLALGITTLIIFYWTFKYILLRRSCIPSFLGKEIGYEAIEIMEFVPLFLASGDIFFNLIFYQTTGFISYVTLAISIFNFMFPMGWLNKQLMPFEEKKIARLESPLNTIEYSIARVNLTEEYDRCNPITQQQATEDWIKFIEKREEKNTNGVDNQRTEKIKKGGRSNQTDRTEININSGVDIGALQNYSSNVQGYGRGVHRKGKMGSHFLPKRN